MLILAGIVPACQCAIATVKTTVLEPVVLNGRSGCVELSAWHRFCFEPFHNFGRSYVRECYTSTFILELNRKGSCHNQCLDALGDQEWFLGVDGGWP